MKRYDSYKDSGVQWIGRIPNHWGINRMRFIINYEKGKNPKELSFEEKDGMLPYLSMDYLRGNYDFTQYSYPTENSVICVSGDIVLLWDGSNAGEFLKSKDGILCSTCAVIKQKNIDKQYYWYLCKSLQSFLKDMTNGMGIPHVDSKELKNLTVLTPPILEQQAIASYLDKRCEEIDKAIAKQQKRIELLQELRQNIITNAITHGINPDTPLKDSGVEWIGQVPEHWEIMKIKHVVTTNSGSTPKNIKGKDTDEANIIWVRTTDLTGYVVKDSSEYLTEEEFKSASCPLLPEGTVLVAMYGGAGTIGKCGILGREATINQALCSLIGKRGITQLFLFYCTLAMKGYWMKFAASSRKDPNISQEIIRNVMIPIPPEKEQNEIVQFVVSETKEIDDSIKQANKRIALLQELKQSIITEVVTGKRKVC